MTYVDAYHNRETDRIHIVERVNGKRVFNTIKAEYSFYYKAANGNYESIYNERLSKSIASSSKNFRIELANFTDEQLYESDIKPVFKVLESHYSGVNTPELQNAAIDIEVDFCKERGYAPPDDPHQAITAITISYDWLSKIVTLVLAPKTLTQAQAQEICDRFENCILCDDEKQLLEMFFELVEDVDVLYTWNGEGFDIPYIINRTVRILGKDYTRKLCLWDQFPKEREFERYGKKAKTYDLIGRIHLDYLQLYRKFTYHEMHSYRLDAIGEYELGLNKVAYEGTLDQLYNNDFEKFIEYNRQDTVLLSKLDAKLMFIGLVNRLAHDNCVLFQTTLGAVALTDQAIVLEAHKRNLIVPSRVHGKNANFGIAGGFVAEPKSGQLWNWIGSVDINSLYPSAIRALNMSPETLVAQLVPKLTDEYVHGKMNAGGTFADAWNNMFSCLEYQEVLNETNTEISVYFEREKETHTMTAKEIYDWVFSNPGLCMSANGTIFSCDKEGVVPGLLTKWYAARKEEQAKHQKYEGLAYKEKDPVKKKAYEIKRDFWYQRQMATKIKLNALYGAISNVASRFADQRIGQSTTLTGRTITQHMNAKVNEILSKEYKHDGKCIIYADTDSAYFTVSPVLPELKQNGFKIDKESFADLSDNIADMVNESFPDFMKDKFNIETEKGKLIRCGRENCAFSGIFPNKKRYAILVYDKEGKRKDVDGKPGELKIMGMETQRADTPKSIQIFLKDVLMKVLEGNPETDVIDFIRDFRKKVKELSGWELGTPKRVNNLTDYKARIKNKAKSSVKGFTVPQHVQASLNWNKLRDMYGDNTSMPIMDGQKVVVCVLKENPSKLKCVAYPIDEQRLPDWFKKMPFDTSLMEGKLIDNKLDNVIGSLGWNLALSKTSASFSTLFTLE